MVLPMVERLIGRPGLRLRHWPAWLPEGRAAELFAALQDEVPWKQEAITLYGRRHLLPRLTCWMADPGCGYRYSGLANVIEPWSPAAAALRQALQELTGWRFNSLLLNRYRDGRDAMGWHADDEPELGAEPVIASVSFGAERNFRLRHRESKELQQISLGSGSLLVMSGLSQACWMHDVPKTKKFVVVEVMTE